MEHREFADRVHAAQERLYRIAYGQLREEQDRKDAVQEAILKAWQSRNRLRDAAYFETWLIRILINECRRFYRKNPVPGEPLPESLTAPEESSAVMDALMNLPEKHRIALELHCIEGYSVREIARMLRLPEGTVKWRLSRARTLMQQELGEEACK